MLMREEELGSQSPVSYEEDFEDLSSNADLYVFNDQMVQGYRGVNLYILSRAEVTTLKAIYIRMKSIRLDLHTTALIGNVQIRVLCYVLQKSRVIRLQASFRLARVTQ